MLRDLYLAGNRQFRSDIDLVVDPSSLVEFDRLLDRYDVKSNRFGGYGLRLGRWRIDVWPLERTWAAVHGYVEVRELRDLLKITFFDWDAVLYEISQKTVVCEEEWFAKINNRVLDINLKPNPNPIGNSVRALRYAWRWNAKLGPRLAEHVHNQLAEAGWEAMLEAEQRSFHTRILQYLNQNDIERALSEMERNGWSGTADFRLAREEEDLFFNRSAHPRD